ncbi:anhydro-N-acetylmuramic acid kinase [Marinobacter zhanjiangensis]|uniref:Anhydro-N-acetylmuramic acid kinase n=1 Tax=Marinobacter zhanjiangensis TaxID=578215 RepID=A0ABQ3BC15_9GAMM|nr:anhydro-N-acetylmuramic acid kinase [Marinobacter zhanjiangensis]GGY83255.1 anhydro-N-acetylmuramic acid kinase [Marinobacter zhanjiangensis]
MPLYIGLMSGTSMDGIDAALVDLDEAGGATLVATHTEPFPDSLYRSIVSLSQNHGTPDNLGHCDRALGECFATATLNLLETAGHRGSVVAIGSHGQTIRHQPQGEHPFSLQLGDPNVIAERTGITTVADFRRRDMAAGGQGAPLVPAFHHAVFASPLEHRVLLNIGGIANISWLPAGGAGASGGFDTGPGNGLMDAWCQRHTGRAYDENGRWAHSGKVVTPLLDRLLAEPYFSLPAPKSTGKELFNLDWLDARLSREAEYAPGDVQRTLLELTARSIAGALPTERPLRLYVCGGGALNSTLMLRLRELLEPQHVHVATTGELGIDPQWVEAAAFAWLARQTMEGLAGNVPGVTGATGPRVLGAIYPG